MNREVICFDAVAPVRERGLKYTINTAADTGTPCRSREGAWIEIPHFFLAVHLLSGRSREGAWIEIVDAIKRSEEAAHVAPVRERGLK